MLKYISKLIFAPPPGISVTGEGPWTSFLYRQNQENDFTNDTQTISILQIQIVQINYWTWNWRYTLLLKQCRVGEFSFRFGFLTEEVSWQNMVLKNHLLFLLTWSQIFSFLYHSTSFVNSNSKNLLVKFMHIFYFHFSHILSTIFRNRHLVDWINLHEFNSLENNLGSFHIFFIIFFNRLNSSSGFMLQL